MKENAVIAALPPMTKYSYSTGLSPKQCFLYRYLYCVVESSALQKKEERKVVSEQATLASLEPRTTSHLRCPSTR